KKLLFLLVLASCTSSQKDEEGLIAVNGTSLYYHSIGKGEPVIVIHGGPVLDQSYMIDHFKELAKNHRLIFYDQRVSGKSTVDVDTSTMTMKTLIEDIDQLRQKLGFEQVHVLGHSWGGMLAAKYAIEYPLKVKSLVLCDAMPPSFRLWNEEEQVLAQRTSAYDSLLLDQIKEQPGFKNQEVKWVDSLMKIAFKSQFVDTTKLALLKIKLPADYFKRSKIFEHVGPELFTFDLTTQLEKIIAPTLIIYGEQEPAAKISGPVYKSGIADSKLVIIPNSGHFPFIEQPLRFNLAVEAFWRGENK
ncbi:MAG TPA: alpha/beta fold hydrolase, partial [Cyclobacteriaceae bacterium]|nr:alpha/beta fold hydrolase [Cyclobacteriaceae bacterium]